MLTANAIPLCVPRWDERAALKEGAEYSRELGFHVPAEAYLDNVWNWLPLRWKYPDKPALLPEMLPSSSWEQNLRTALTPAKWDALRRHCYAAAGNRCEICGEAGRVECHEKWAFDDLMCVQSLGGLISLCGICHKAHHLGFARRLGVYGQVLEKMMDVNSWSHAQLGQAMEQAEKLAQERDRYYWHVDLSWLETGRYNLIYQLDGKR